MADSEFVTIAFTLSVRSSNADTTPLALNARNNESERVAGGWDEQRPLERLLRRAQSY
jgi:hypothetical protein